MEKHAKTPVGLVNEVLQRFVEVDPGMTVRQAMSIIAVALEPGRTVTELSKKVGATVAASSRHFTKLNGSDGGPSLIAGGYGEDGRKKALMLTDEGRRLVGQLVSIVKRGGQEHGHSAG